MVGLTKLLRVPDVVRLTGLEKWRVYDLVSSEEIPYMRIGRTIRFSEAALVAWIEEQHARESVRSEGQEVAR